MVEMRETDEATRRPGRARAAGARARQSRTRQTGDDHAGITPRQLTSSDGLPDAIEQLHDFRLEGLEAGQGGRDESRTVG
jgi:hypothetical protein